MYGDKISAKTKVSCLSTKQNVWTKAEKTIDIDSFTSEETRVNHRFVLRLNMHKQIHCIHTIRRVSLTKHSITCNCLLNSIENIDTRVWFVETLFQMYETLQRTHHKELYSIEFYWRHILLCKLKTYLAIIILAMQKLYLKKERKRNFIASLRQSVVESLPEIKLSLYTLK